MSAFYVALLASLGISTWIFTKLQGRTGYGNSKSALTASGIAFILVFLIVFTVYRMVTSN